MRIDHGQSPALFRLASQRLGSLHKGEWNQKILTAFNRRIEGQCVFTSIEPGVKCEISIWAEPTRGLRCGHHFVRSIFHVAFVEWKCQRVHAVTRKSNEPAWRALIAMGFEFEASLKAWFGTEEGWMYRLLRDDCRWLKGK